MYVRKTPPAIIFPRALAMAQYAYVFSIASAAAEISCETLSSSAIKVSFPCVNATDLYYVAIFATKLDAVATTPKPAAIVTTVNCSTVLEDLVPSTTYYLRIRSHPSKAPSVVWGWRNYSSPVRPCTTMAAPAYAVHRHGALEPHQLGLEWHIKSGHSADFASGEVTPVWRRTLSSTLATSLGRPLGTMDSNMWEEATPDPASGVASGVATVTGLNPGSSYVIVLRGPNGTALSDPVRFRTGAIGSSYETVYRVAEETHDIDLLLNHNAGDLKGEAAFLSDSGNYKLTPRQIAEDPCAQALNRTHCRPGSADCMACAGLVWVNGTGQVADAVRKQCSNPSLPFPTDNKAAENWCGDGFSFFDWSLTPVTEYW